MELIILNYPAEDIEAIEQIVADRKSFIGLLDGELYRIVHYLRASSELEIAAMLDRNVYTRITALVRGEDVSPDAQANLRWASAVLAFCQIAGITLDYASSLYEFAQVRGGVAAIEELNLFWIADNSDPRLFVNFALGRIPKIRPDELTRSKPSLTMPTPEEFERKLRDFRINYTFALKIVDLSRENVPSVEKMIRLLDWMYSKFIFGSPALLFATRYFSPNRHRRMLKSFAKRDIENAAWDMTLIQGWRRAALKGAKDNRPVLLISGDKAVQDMAVRMMADSEEVALTTMRELWGRNTSEGKRVYEHYVEVWKKVSAGRMPPSAEAQMAILDELERRVFGGADGAIGS